MVCSWFFWPFHQSSTPYNAVYYTTDNWIRWTSPGKNPHVCCNPLIWISAARSLLILSLMWEVKLDWLSSQIPNHRLASLLIMIFSLPNLIWPLVTACSVVSGVFRRKKKQPLPLMYRRLLPHSTVLATFSRIFTISFTELPEAINPRSSIEDKDVPRAGLRYFVKYSTDLYQEEYGRNWRSLRDSGCHFSLLYSVRINNQLYLSVVQKGVCPCNKISVSPH